MCLPNNIGTTGRRKINKDARARTPSKPPQPPPPTKRIPCVVVIYGVHSCRVCTHANTIYTRGRPFWKKPKKKPSGQLTSRSLFARRHWSRRRAFHYYNPFVLYERRKRKLPVKRVAMAGVILIEAFVATPDPRQSIKTDTWIVIAFKKKLKTLRCNNDLDVVI